MPARSGEGGGGTSAFSVCVARHHLALRPIDSTGGRDKYSVRSKASAVPDLQEEVSVEQL